MKDLSIIVVSYNTKDITSKCLDAILQSIGNVIKYEIIVVDNASTDGSLKYLQELKNKYPYFHLIANKINYGFSKANNQAIKTATGRYILFLNSDVIIKKVNFEELTNYLDKHPDVGVMTVKVVLSSGQIDPASHRGFPTIWNSFCYYTQLERLLGKSPFLGKYFSGYHLLDRDFDTIHEIDSPSGAFYLTRKEILDQVGSFDESFFMYGEDLDLSFRIKKEHYKIIYYPLGEVVHLKHSSGLGDRVDQILKDSIKNHFYNAMKIFYKKHYEKNNYWLINKLIYSLIDIKRLL